MNAHVGLTSPGHIGARRLPSQPAQDVLYPARGGGPGMGPIRRRDSSGALPSRPPVLARFPLSTLALNFNLSPSARSPSAPYGSATSSRFPGCISS